MLLQSISGFVYELNTGSTSSLIALMVALITSLDLPLLLSYWLPFSQPKSLDWIANCDPEPVQSLVSGPAHPLFWETAFQRTSEWGTCAAFQFPCVTGALIRLNFVTEFWFLCSLLSVLFFNFAACDQYTSVWNPFPCCYSASNVQRTVNILSVFLVIFSSPFAKK